MCDVVYEKRPKCWIYLPLNTLTTRYKISHTELRGVNENAGGQCVKDRGLQTWLLVKIAKLGFHQHPLEDTIYQSSTIVHRNRTLQVLFYFQMIMQNYCPQCGINLFFLIMVARTAPNTPYGHFSYIWITCSNMNFYMSWEQSAALVVGHP